MSLNLDLNKISLSFDETHHIFDGKPLYHRKFKKVLSFHPPGVAAVEDEKGAYHINLEGKPIYESRFLKTFGFYEGYAAVADESGWYHIDLSGNPVYVERFAWVGNFREAMCVVRDFEGKFFHISTSGKPAYPQKYEYVGDFKHGIAVVYTEEGIAKHVDREGMFIHDREYQELGVFHKGFAIARDMEGYFHIDKQGDPLYNDRYQWVEPFYNGFALVKTRKGAMGIIDERGLWVHSICDETNEVYLSQIKADLVGFWKPQLVFSAVKLGLIEYLSSKGKNRIKQIAKDLDINEDGLWRLSRALVSMEYLKIEGENVGLDKKGAILNDQLNYAALMWGEEHFIAFSRLSDVIKKGASVFQEIYGKPFFDYIADDNNKLWSYQKAIAQYAVLDYAEIPNLIDFSKHRVLMDVGGGTGVLLKLIMHQYQTIRGKLLESPQVVEMIREHKLITDRTARELKIIPGNFLEKIPDGADGIILSRVIHDWDNIHAQRILSNVHKALTKEGLLYIIEIARAEKFDKDLGLSLDLNMLCITNGRERTFQELQLLITQGGFKIKDIKQTGILTVFICYKPSPDIL